MFREPIEPVFKLKRSNFLFTIFLFGFILMIFASADLFLLFLGIFLFVSSILIIFVEVYLYQNRLNAYHKRIQKIKDSHIQQLDKFSGEKFEFYLKKLFEDLSNANHTDWVSVFVKQSTMITSIFSFELVCILRAYILFWWLFLRYKFTSWGSWTMVLKS